ncbi:methyltransferase family protein [Pseudomonas duriflava]|uniref:Methyltransferase family protein n=1 Tax=Pseudomonas duriflava TaxID=459528 RepID=A0A562QA40_9PSED|nr:class I SAM-dependent methyltransferase [Pseudomonas duriflava]TWI53574.1 methyltransferase family protein [Pseudomonas duriflava]
MNEEERNKTLAANIAVHSFLSNIGEYDKSPHFLPENKAKVRSVIEGLYKSLNPSCARKAIDFGCGTGFIINLERDLFDEIHGVDITWDMMKHIDCSSHNVTLHQCRAEETGLESNYFDFASAYSFMDHLYNYEDFLKEAHRVLRKGGIFYSDLNPNKDFILLMEGLAEKSNEALPRVIVKEIKGAIKNGTVYQDKYELDPDLLEKAEPIKSLNKGFDASEVLEVARKIGFSSFKVEYHWFLGQAEVMHKQSFENAEVVNSYLKSIIPASTSLYKYLSFIFVK